MRVPGCRWLDFDIENRPLNYGSADYTFSDITAIACQFVGSPKSLRCWLLGRDSPAAMLQGFLDFYNEAGGVAGHYIRQHDLPTINGALLERGFPPLSPKLSHDTYLDLDKRKGVSGSQENLAAMLGIRQPKVSMSHRDWRAANRLEELDLTERRVVGDVRQNIALRKELLARGWLKPPKVWSP